MLRYDFPLRVDHPAVEYTSKALNRIALVLEKTSLDAHYLDGS